MPTEMRLKNPKLECQAQSRGKTRMKEGTVPKGDRSPELSSVTCPLWGLSFFFIVLLIISLTFTGCASVIKNSPKMPIAKYFSMPGSFAEVWDVTVTTLESEHIPIESMDESTGLIQVAEFKVQKEEYNTWASKTLPAPHGFASFEIQVSPVSDMRTQLQISSQFQGGKHGVIVSKGWHHESTGVFENRLAARIHAYLIMKKFPILMQLIIGCNFRWNDEIGYYEITGVAPGSFGEEQGFQNGDIIIQLDGVQMTMENFFMSLTAVNETVTKKFFMDRGGEGMLIEVEVIFIPQDVPQFGFAAEWTARRTDPVNRPYFIITNVSKKSPAEIAGLQVGDILLQEEATMLSSWRAYYHAMSGARIGIPRNFLIWREGAEQWVTIETQKTGTGHVA